MSLYDDLIAALPELAEKPQEFTSTGSILLQNDGDEKQDYIASWNYPTLTRPTDEQLA
jgi:hypothetical protein